MVCESLCVTHASLSEQLHFCCADSVYIRVWSYRLGSCWKCFLLTIIHTLIWNMLSSSSTLGSTKERNTCPKIELLYISLSWASHNFQTSDRYVKPTSNNYETGATHVLGITNAGDSLRKWSVTEVNLIMDAMTNWSCCLMALQNLKCINNWITTSVTGQQIVINQVK